MAIRGRDHRATIAVVGVALILVIFSLVDFNFVLVNLSKSPASGVKLLRRSNNDASALNASLNVIESNASTPIEEKSPGEATNAAAFDLDMIKNENDRQHDSSQPQSFDDDNLAFDESLTLNDLTRIARSLDRTTAPPARWLEQCVTAVENDPTIYRPWQNFDGDTSRDKSHYIYRLGDCIRLCDQCSNKGRREMPYKEFSVYYGEMACDQEDEEKQLENFHVLEDIFHIVENDINRTGDFNAPDPESVIIHMRLGDVIELGWKLDGSREQNSASYFLVHGGVSDHPIYRGVLEQLKTNATAHLQKSIFSVQDYLDALHIANANKAVIVGGSHKQKQYKKSKPYAYCLAKGLAFAGIKVELRLDQKVTHPDSDFYYMSHAKKFVLSSGGFSSVISRMVVHMGGEVLQSGELLPFK
ncbi:MAG: hypothetical protein SGILL_010504 [Bacillariaceae sp.]